MNHAFIDASWQESPDDLPGLGGWGLVLIRPQQLPQRFQGQLLAPDNNAAELRAVLEAVQLAPAGQSLVVQTDNQAVLTCLRGHGPLLLHELSQEVHQAAQRRSIALRSSYTPRTWRHMQAAHELANAARKGQPCALTVQQTDLLLEQHLQEARIALHRPGERLSATVLLDHRSAVPPSLQVLLSGVALLQPQEQVLVRRASKLAQALWHKPERALRPEVLTPLRRAREQADEQSITLVFA